MKENVKNVNSENGNGGCNEADQELRKYIQSLDMKVQQDLLDDKVNTKKELKKLKNEMKNMKEEYKNCTEALLKEVYEKNKAEEMCKVLKDTLEAENELNKVAEDKEKQSDCDQKEINSVEEMSVDGEKDSDRWKKTIFQK